MKNLISFFSIVLLLVVMTMPNAEAHVAGPLSWEKLGSKKVDFRADRDVIKVGYHEGQFKKLRLVVTEGSLYMHKMVVEYANGSKETINVRHQFNQRSTSRTIDLKGNKRVIKDITFYYKSTKRKQGKAKLTVLGR